jgi:hypothetical protein
MNLLAGMLSGGNSKNQLLSQFRSLLSDGAIASSEKEKIKSNISEAIANFQAQNPEVLELRQLIQASTTWLK